MAETKNEPKKQISWSAPEFIQYQKGPWWYISLVVVGLALVVYFAIQKDFLTAVLFVILGILIWYFGKAKPREIKIQIDSAGIRLNESRYPYQQIKKFWIVYDPPLVKTLNFQTTARLNAKFTVQLGSTDPVEVRNVLLEYLPEDLDAVEDFSDKIGRKLKF